MKCKKTQKKDGSYQLIVGLCSSVVCAQNVETGCCGFDSCNNQIFLYFSPFFWMWSTNFFNCYCAKILFIQIYWLFCTTLNNTPVTSLRMFIFFFFCNFIHEKTQFFWKVEKKNTHPASINGQRQSKGFGISGDYYIRHTSSNSSFHEISIKMGWKNSSAVFEPMEQEIIIP